VCGRVSACIPRPLGNLAGCCWGLLLAPTPLLTPVRVQCPQLGFTDSFLCSIWLIPWACMCKRCPGAVLPVDAVADKDMVTTLGVCSLPPLWLGTS
jgi:hypothetical protein